MNVDEFAQKVEEWFSRVVALLQRTDRAMVSTDGTSELPHEQQELLKEASEELHIALEELHVAQEQLYEQHDKLLQQNQELVAAREAVEAERQRYQELFELAPDGYLVTDVDGNIQEANRAAGLLFNIKPQFLVGKPLSFFIVSLENIGKNYTTSLTGHGDLDISGGEKC